MSDLPELGKIHPEFFNKVIYPRLGNKDPKVIVGPQHGVDVGIVEIGGEDGLTGWDGGGVTVDGVDPVEGVVYRHDGIPIVMEGPYG